MAENQRRKPVLWGLVLLVLIGGAAAWWQRTALLTWWYVRGLARSTEQDRVAWVNRVAGLGESALPAVLELFGRDEPAVCDNGTAALICMAGQWGVEDRRTLDLVLALANGHEQYSQPGRAEALEVVAAILQTTPHGGQSPPEVQIACSRLLHTQPTSAEQTGASLQVTELLLLQSGQPEVVYACRDSLRWALAGELPQHRLQAIKLILSAGLKLHDQIALRLTDESADVRRAALLAVGTASDQVTDETLLPCLRDSDEDVRRLCEAALRARGLTHEHIQMGRLLIDPDPRIRLQVLDHLFRDHDLDPGVWLRRLSHDPSDSVRAAAARAMGMQTLVDLSDRLDQMTHTDPSPTVCSLAEYYLQRARQK
jgi:hypothetical protein